MKKVNYQIISENINRIKKSYSNLNLCLKDNAYHNDIKMLVELSTKANINRFSTNSIKEAAKIVSLAPNSLILILGLEKEKNDHFILTVDSMDDYAWMKENNQPYYIKIKSDMNRFGMELNPYIYHDKLCQGVYLHNPYSKHSYKFLKYVNEIVDIFKISPSSISVGGSSLYGYEFDYELRIGAMLYQNAITYEAQIIKIRTIGKNEGVGYDLKYKVRHTKRIAIINIGYKNGFKRDNKGSYVSINHKKYKLIGYKCMDYAFILIDNTVKKDDTVYIIGQSIQMNDFLKSEGISFHEFLVKIN